MGEMNKGSHAEGPHPSQQLSVRAEGGKTSARAHKHEALHSVCGRPSFDGYPSAGGCKGKQSSLLLAPTTVPDERRTHQQTLPQV